MLGILSESLKGQKQISRGLIFLIFAPGIEVEIVRGFVSPLHWSEKPDEKIGTYGILKYSVRLYFFVAP